MKVSCGNPLNLLKIANVAWCVAQAAQQSVQDNDTFDRSQGMPHDEIDSVATEQASQLFNWSFYFSSTWLKFVISFT